MKIDKVNKSIILNCDTIIRFSAFQVAKEFKRQINKTVTIVIAPKRAGDLGKIIASNNKLKKFIKWKPKFNKLNFIVKSCIKWELTNKNKRN